MDNDLLKLLEGSGFTPKEAQVYMALLELGQGTVTNIAKITNLKRSIIYVILEGLLKRGYTSELPGRKINTYQGVDPSIILLQLKGIAKNFSEMLPMLRTLSSKGKNKPKIIYHETKEGIARAWDEMQTIDDVFYISSYERIEQHFPESIAGWLNGYNKKLHPIGNRHLIPKRESSLKLTADLHSIGERIRFLEEFNDIKMDFTLYGNKIAITSLEENPFIVVIESESLVNSIRPIFEIAWKKGREIK